MSYTITESVILEHCLTADWPAERQTALIQDGKLVMVPKILNQAPEAWVLQDLSILNGKDLFYRTGKNFFPLYSVTTRTRVKYGIDT